MLAEAAVCLQRQQQHSHYSPANLAALPLCCSPVPCLCLAPVQGQTVLVENMGETIDAVLTPVITRATFKKASYTVCLAVCAT